MRDFNIFDFMTGEEINKEFHRIRKELINYKELYYSQLDTGTEHINYICELEKENRKLREKLARIINIIDIDNIKKRGF